MFTRLALKAVLTARAANDIRHRCESAAAEMNELNPPFAVYLFSSAVVQFCDFFLITQNGLLVGGIHNLNTFCRDHPSDGLISGNMIMACGTPPYGSVADHTYNLNSTINVARYNQGLFYLFDTQKATWANYGWDGTKLFPITSGRYVIGAPPVAGAGKRGGKSSTKKQ